MARGGGCRKTFRGGGGRGLLLPVPIDCKVQTTVDPLRADDKADDTVVNYIYIYTYYIAYDHEFKAIELQAYNFT